MARPQHSSTQPSLLSDKPFKDWAECFKVLKKLPPALSEPERHQLLKQIEDSSEKHHIAFETLWWIQNDVTAGKVRWLENPLLLLLGGGDEEPQLSRKTPTSEAGKWVRREMSEVRTMADWARLVTTGRHFWILHAILKSASNKHALIEAISALAEWAEGCQNSRAAGKVRRKIIGVAETRWIAKMIKSRVPLTPDLPKPFLESLFAIRATAELSESVRRENDNLQSQLREAETERDAEKQARTRSETHANAIEAQLNGTIQELQNARSELREERLHTTRQGGFNAVARRETINHVLSTVRQGINHRLENIRGYADRENPNREEILALVDEIEKHLSKIEEVVGE